MCGIAGELVLRRGDRPSPDRVRAMCDVMVHRGPDDFGSHSDAEAALGMRRLSIVDVAGGHQPLGNADGTVQVVCNGEIYNHRALRAELAARGHRFRTGSDVEVIAHLYDEEGVAGIRKLEGMFALALWDARAHRLVLGRDRIGIKPLYVAEAHGRLLFGSEAKCLLAGGLRAAIRASTAARASSRPPTSWSPSRGRMAASARGSSATGTSRATRRRRARRARPTGRTSWSRPSGTRSRAT
jgi:asparagine synthase (glutamine-hydrolysing)